LFSSSNTPQLASQRPRILAHWVTLSTPPFFRHLVKRRLTRINLVNGFVQSGLTCTASKA
ncbi:hypothetical protein, partial [Zooshikella sp. RANM57]|uniref:hypothetical protein n=1 Tax=Zooshikella sp. RANM57 TaxID=3425863 RepID=UPI003D6F6D0C